MKTEAIYFVGPRKTEIREVEVSDPQPHQVQVLCKATGICMAEASRFSETDRLAFPFVPGREGFLGVPLVFMQQRHRALDLPDLLDEVRL